MKNKKRKIQFYYNFNFLKDSNIKKRKLNIKNASVFIYCYYY